MRRAALVMTHGGHGAAMRALKHGVPMVVIPGLAGDQPFVAAAIQEFGAGLALPGDADTAAMGAAALETLSNPSYREQARRRSRALAPIEGAEITAQAVEEVPYNADRTLAAE
jgi:UDP:flavonoid glycosyltransferase YjiC (YdhE family)